jgi:hypothetical protein
MRHHRMESSSGSIHHEQDKELYSNGVTPQEPMPFGIVRGSRIGFSALPKSPVYSVLYAL